MSMEPYRYALSLTSQFPFCGLPLRLDAYSRCQFNCLYCFASARGGQRGDRRVAPVDVAAISRRLERAVTEPPRSVLDEFLAHRQPIHLGGMSDPLSPIEEACGATRQILNVLADSHYPTVLSTKSDLLLRDEYLATLKRGKFVVQLSIMTLDDALSAIVDMGAPNSSSRLKVLELLRSEGIPTDCRIQPLVPGREGDAREVIEACAQRGVRHVSVEHLKLPIERKWWGTRRMSTALGVDVPAYFAAHQAERVGREWILGAESRRERILDLRDFARSLGLTFGAADNDLLLLSDGQCCCSGVDLVANFGTFFRFTYTEAVRRGAASNRITPACLDGVWCPRKSVGEFINSRSRLTKQAGKGAGIDRYIWNNWNGRPNGFSPRSLHGIEDSGERDRDGFVVYHLSEEMRSLLSYSPSRLSIGI